MPETKTTSQLPTPVKVVILEDNKHQRMGMIAELETNPNIEIVGATAQPHELIEMVQEHQPDVAFIDLRIYGDLKVGAATIREIKEIRPEVKCIVLTAFVELPNFLAAFDAGAEGFIRKDAMPDQQPLLDEMVRIVTSGGRYYDYEVINQMRAYLDPTRFPQSTGSAATTNNPLTPREREILLELARKKSTAEIAVALCIAENTVKAHISNIMSKSGAKDRREIVLIAISKGWLGSETAPD